MKRAYLVIIIYFYTCSLIFGLNIVQDRLQLPPSILQYIEKNLVEMEIVEITSFSSYWEGYYHGDENFPNYCSGDFNSDGQLDYSVLLSNDIGDVVVYALLCSDDGGFISIMVDTILFTGIEDGNKLDFGLKKVMNESGQEGLWLYHFEKPSSEYYWSNGEFLKE